MTSRTALQVGGGAALLALLGWGVVAGLQRLVDPQPTAPPAVVVDAPAPTAHITATLFYGSEDGQTLVASRQEVPLAEGVIAQGEQILEALLQPAPEPHAPLIPPGTRLRQFYVTAQGDAFVDFSRELSTAHPGGSHTELLTLYAIVNTVTSNLPAVQRVQILVEGREVDTIAGHVDVRRPIQPDMTLVKQP